ncbi:unnamed protein product [Aureobasidium pullulans]|nr:unnamed protein product [Aureobasidium pullulans]
MTDHSTYSPIGAGSPDLHSNPRVPSTPNVPSTPDLPSSPTANVTESDGLTSYPPTPQGLSRRQLNLFKRQRKAALKLAMLMATELEDPTSSPSTFHHVFDTENDTDIPGDYKEAILVVRLVNCSNPRTSMKDGRDEGEEDNPNGLNNFRKVWQDFLF